MVFHPACQVGSLVVKEYTTICHGRFAVGVGAWLKTGCGIMLNRHVGPPIPRRHAELFRQFVDAVYGTTPVTPDNHHRAVHILARAFHRRYDELLPLPHYVLPGDGLILYQPVCHRRTHSSDNDAGRAVRISTYPRPFATNGLKILRQIPGCDNRRRIHFLIYVDSGWFPIIYQRIITLPGIKRYKLLGSHSSDRHHHSREQ